MICPPGFIEQLVLSIAFDTEKERNTLRACKKSIKQAVYQLGLQWLEQIRKANAEQVGYLQLLPVLSFSQLNDSLTFKIGKLFGLKLHFCPSILENWPKLGDAFFMGSFFPFNALKRYDIGLEWQTNNLRLLPHYFSHQPNPGYLLPMLWEDALKGGGYGCYF